MLRFLVIMSLLGFGLQGFSEEKPEVSYDVENMLSKYASDVANCEVDELNISSLSDVKNICQSLVNSEVCSSVEPEYRMDCDNLVLEDNEYKFGFSEESPEESVRVFNKTCEVGVEEQQEMMTESFKSMAILMGAGVVRVSGIEVLTGDFEWTTESIDSAKSAWNSIVAEADRLEEEEQVDPRASFVRAAFVDPMINEYEAYGCLNDKGRQKKMCESMAEGFGAFGTVGKAGGSVLGNFFRRGRSEKSKDSHLEEVESQASLTTRRREAYDNKVKELESTEMRISELRKEVSDYQSGLNTLQENLDAVRKSRAPNPRLETDYVNRIVNGEFLIAEKQKRISLLETLAKMQRDEVKNLSKYVPESAVVRRLPEQQQQQGRPSATPTRAQTPESAVVRRQPEQQQGRPSAMPVQASEQGTTSKVVNFFSKVFGKKRKNAERDTLDTDITVTRSQKVTKTEVTDITVTQKQTLTADETPVEGQPLFPPSSSPTSVPTTSKTSPSPKPPRTPRVNLNNITESSKPEAPRILPPGSLKASPPLIDKMVGRAQREAQLEMNRDGRSAKTN